MRDEATYDAIAYPRMLCLHPRWRSITVAAAKVIAEWPDGNDRLFEPSGRSRWTASLIGSTIDSVRICARRRSIPRCDVFSDPMIRPVANVPSDNAICSGVLPTYFAGAYARFTVV